MQAPSGDGDGYLVDPDQWTENWARHTAAAMNIDLTPEHWEAIRFMRAFYEEHRVPADARFVMRHLSETRGASRNRLFELFPYGYPDRPARSPACAARASGAQAEADDVRVRRLVDPAMPIPGGTAWLFRRDTGTLSFRRRCSRRWAQRLRGR